MVVRTQRPDLLHTMGRSWIAPDGARVTRIASGWPPPLAGASAVTWASARCHAGTCECRFTVRMCHNRAAPCLQFELTGQEHDVLISPLPDW